MGNENNILWDKIFWGQLNEDGFREVSKFKIEESDDKSYMLIPKVKNEIKVDEKELIRELIKEARERVDALENIDIMKPLEKIRCGVPMRLKVWLKDMFLIFRNDKLYIVFNNTVVESECVSMILSHQDNEWEEYDITYSKGIIKKEDYNCFIDNIYKKLAEVELTTIEQNVILSMKMILEKFM